MSDVTAFVTFEDRKNICGTEQGTILIWEGNLIKAVIKENETTPCHKGQIEILLIEGDTIISAGQDGFIKVWDYNEID